MCAKEKRRRIARSPLKLEQANPYLFIKDFFSVAPLPYYRKFIFQMLSSAYSEGYWNKSDPGTFIFVQQQILELISASHFILETDSLSKRLKPSVKVKELYIEQDINSSLYEIMPGDEIIWDAFPRYLNKKEFLDPFKAYSKFFEFKNLGDWLEEFKDLVSFALEPFGNETGSEYNYLQIYILLQKLIEASHLIYIRSSKIVSPQRA